jgi:hypothetical protein
MPNQQPSHTTPVPDSLPDKRNCPCSILVICRCARCVRYPGAASARSKPKVVVFSGTVKSIIKSSRNHERPPHQRGLAPDYQRATRPLLNLAPFCLISLPEGLGVKTSQPRLYGIPTPTFEFRMKVAEGFRAKYRIGVNIRQQVVSSGSGTRLSSRTQSSTAVRHESHRMLRGDQNAAVRGIAVHHDDLTRVGSLGCRQAAVEQSRSVPITNDY